MGGGGRSDGSRAEVRADLPRGQGQSRSLVAWAGGASEQTPETGALRVRQRRGSAELPSERWLSTDMQH